MKDLLTRGHETLQRLALNRMHMQGCLDNDHVRDIYKVSEEVSATIQDLMTEVEFLRKRVL